MDPSDPQTSLKSPPTITGVRRWSDAKGWLDRKRFNCHFLNTCDRPRCKLKTCKVRDRPRPGGRTRIHAWSTLRRLVRGIVRSMFRVSVMGKRLRIAFP